jgi:ribose transport system permease protein
LRKPWLWAWIAAIGVFAVTIAATAGASAAASRRRRFTFAAFSVIVGLGQMFVITLGPGNVDLSIPATMTLAGTVSLKLMDGAEGMVLAGDRRGAGHRGGRGRRELRAHQGAAHPADHRHAGAVLHRAVGGDLDEPGAPDQAARGRWPTSPPAIVAGVPNVALVALALTVAAWVLLERSAYGRRVTAIGQSLPAARRAGVPVDGVRLATYVLCAMLAGLCGFLLSCFSGGAALNMGAEYLLISIAVVVIGGSSVAGGQLERAGHLGRGAVPVPRRLDAQHLRLRRRAEADPHRVHHHRRHPRRQHAGPGGRGRLT